MLRWLVRLLIAGLIAAAVAFALARLLGQDEEDFDDFDDFDTEFEFETPVEIDVPADGATSTTTMASGETSGTPARVSSARAAATAPLRSLESIEGDTDMTAQTAAGEGGNLIDINGIGPAYEARLQAIGITTMADLASADSNRIAEQIDVIGGVNAVEDWISQARAFVEGRWDEGGQG
jgi:predicted flap endonuclease-1-like 5' DNA nuclease